MKRILIKLVTTSFLIISLLSTNIAVADDDDDHHEKKWWNVFSNDDDDDYKQDRSRNKDDRHQGDRKGYSSRYLPIVNHPAYIKECGACHFTFQPGLLPSESWEKIMANLENHFDDDASLKEEVKMDILNYLREGAAENSGAKRSVKIMRTLGNRSPLRVTETPYMIKEHRKLSQRIIKQKSIKTLSNCTACHTSADRGIYSERYIHIPE